MTVRTQDVGGLHGFGAVPIAQGEPAFNGRWEASVVAGILATLSAGVYNVDEFRAPMDELPPLAYMSLPYFGKWMHTLEVNCVRAGIFTAEQVDERMEVLSRGDAPLQLADGDVTVAMRTFIVESAVDAVTVDRSARFSPGDAVRGRAMVGSRHARIPLYVQGRPGVVDRVRGALPFPDASLSGQGESHEYVYSVRFEGGDLWDAGEAAVFLDLCEPYLEPVEAR
jgi:nitrile hydratase subunit beta